MKKALARAWGQAQLVGMAKNMTIGVGEGKREREDDEEEEPAAKRARTLTDPEAEAIVDELEHLFTIQKDVKIIRPSDPEANGPVGANQLTLPAILALEERLVNQIPRHPGEFRENALITFWRELYLQLFNPARRGLRLEFMTNGTVWREAFIRAYERRGDVCFIPIHVPLGPDFNVRTDVQRWRDVLKIASTMWGIRGEIAPGMFLTRLESMVLFLKDGSPYVGVFRAWRNDRMRNDRLHTLTTNQSFMGGETGEAMLQLADMISLFAEPLPERLIALGDLPAKLRRSKDLSLMTRPVCLDERGREFDFTRWKLRSSSAIGEMTIWVERMVKIPTGGSYLKLRTDPMGPDIGTFALIGVNLHKKEMRWNQMRLVKTPVNPDEFHQAMNYHSQGQDITIYDGPLNIVRSELPRLEDRGGMPRSQAEMYQEAMTQHVRSESLYTGHWREVHLHPNHNDSFPTRTVTILHNNGRQLDLINYFLDTSSGTDIDGYWSNAHEFTEPVVSVAIVTEMSGPLRHVLVAIGESGQLHVVGLNNRMGSPHERLLYQKDSLVEAQSKEKGLIFEMRYLPPPLQIVDPPVAVKFVRARPLGDVSVLLVDEDGGLWAWGPEGFMASRFLRQENRVGLERPETNWLYGRYIYRAAPTDELPDPYAPPGEVKMLQELEFTERPYLLDFDDMDHVVYLDSCARTADGSADVVLVF